MMFQKQSKKPSTQNRFDQTRLVDTQDLKELSDQFGDITKDPKKDHEAERNNNPVNKAVPED